MQKLKHKLAVTGLIICFMFICPVTVTRAEIPIVRESVENVASDNGGNFADLDIDPINTDSVKNNVVPNTKNEIKKVIRLFIKTMVSVAICAIVLYVVLIFVRKYYGSAFAPPADEEDYDNLELTTPDDKTSALKSFLNRTK